MATFIGEIFDGEDAYIKIIFRLTKCVTKSLRRVFKKYVATYGQTVDAFLSTRRNSVLKGRTGEMNKLVLFPPNNLQTNIDSWDICLIVHVLKTICNRLPKTILLNLEDLRKLRNELVHTECPILEQCRYIEFSKLLSTITKETLIYVDEDSFTDEVEKEVADIEDGKYVHHFSINLRELQQWCSLDPLMLEKIDLVQDGKYIIKTEIIYVFSNSTKRAGVFSHKLK